MTKSAFILGGTGQIGLAVADRLLNADWNVTVSNRGSSTIPKTLLERGVNVASVTRENAGELKLALRSGTDVVVDTTAFDENHAQQLIDVQSSVGSFIIISSCSVYRDEHGRTLDEAATNGFPDMPYGMKESQATVDPGPANYSTKKIALERKMLVDSKIPISIFRPCAIYGVGSTHPREWWFVKRMLDGRSKIPLAYNGKSQFHTCSAVNIAALALVCANKPATRILNIADPSAPSVFEIGEAIAHHMNYRGQLIKTANIAGIGQTPWSVPQPFVLDCSAALELGYVPVVNYRDSVKAVCEWLKQMSNQGDWRKHFPQLANYPTDHFDYKSEDLFFATPLHGRT